MKSKKISYKKNIHNNTKLKKIKLFDPIIDKSEEKEIIKILKSVTGLLGVEKFYNSKMNFMIMLVQNNVLLLTVEL